MHPDVQKLVEVQKVDREISRIRRDLDSLPRETAQREKRLAELRKAVETKKAAATEAELETRRLELAIKQSDEDIKKLDARLNLVKNNAEYQAILFQIEASRKERSDAETEALSKMEQLDPLKAALKDAQAAVVEEEKVFQVFLADAEKIRHAREAEVAKVSVERSALIAGVPKDLLGKYEKLFASRDGLAVAAVEKQICQGCYTQIVMNDIAKLMGKTAIVHCGSCQRILYLPH